MHTLETCRATLLAVLPSCPMGLTPQALGNQMGAHKLYATLLLPGNTQTPGTTSSLLSICSELRCWARCAFGISNLQQSSDLTDAENTTANTANALYLGDKFGKNTNDLGPL